jgi:hypothetical protein
MPYLIDGHNLIGQLPDISLEDPNDEAKLVQKLVGFAARSRSQCVVVFDQGLPGGQSSMSTHSVRVIFASSQHSTADKVMIERINNTQDVAEWTVVSSDQAVVDTARRRGMKILRAPEFTRLLNRPRGKQDESVEVYPSAEEVEEWLKLFGGE